MCVWGGGGGPGDQNSLPLISADPHATRGISDRAGNTAFLHERWGLVDMTVPQKIQVTCDMAFSSIQHKT